MFSKNPGYMLGGLALLAIGGWSMAAIAAESDALEEVVVTAEKRATNLQKTAISIQVYSGEELKKEGKKRIDDIMSGVVGVQSQGSQVGSNFYMRGVDAGGAGAPGGGPNQTAVAVLIDGVYQNRSETVRGGTLDVSQVEVLRGTQSTNLGASSLSGAVSLVSNNPVFQYEANGNVEIGNYNLLTMEGVVNVPLSDHQAIRFAYSSNKRDGYISAGAGDSDLKNARLKYRYKFSDDLDLVLTANHQNIGGNGVSDGVLLYTGHWEPFTGQVNPTTTGGCNYSTAGTSYITVMGCPGTFIAVRDGVDYLHRSDPWDDGYPADRWPNNPFRNTNIDSYSADVNWNTGLGKVTVTPSVQHAHFTSSEPPRGTSWMNQDQVQDTRQLDARIASNPGNSRLEWLAGVYYYYTNLYGTFQNVIFPGSGMGVVGNCTTSTRYCYTWDNSPYGKQQTESAYTDLTYSLTDSFRLKGGLRYSRDTKSFSTSTDTAGNVSGATAPYTYITGDATWVAFTYRAGVEYDLAPQSMLYAMYATGYQPGALNSTNVNGTPKLELEQITLGSKNRFLDDRLQVNVEAFNSQYHNRAIQGSLAPTLVQGETSVNCGRAPGTPTAVAISDTNACINYAGTPIIPNLLSRGVDLEVSYLPTANDRLDFSAEYLESRYEEAPDNVPAYTASDLLTLAGLTAPTAAESANAQALADGWNSLVASYAGLTLQNSPKWTLNADYSHTFSLANGSTLVPRATAIWKSRYWTAGGQSANAANPGLSYQESYSWYNASLSWTTADGKFNVVGNVKNIANKAIMTNYGGTYVSLDQPRTFSISFSANL
ncbi:MAG: TonB-dependent receptor [Steroidobacteraceae bacterium]